MSTEPGGGPTGSRDDATDDERVDAPGDGRTDARTGARWWYLIAAVPVAYVVPFLVVPFVFVLVVLGGLGLGAGDPTGVGPAVGGIGFTLFLIGAAFFALATFVLTLLLPVALYKDAELVQSVSDEWSPDRDLYVLMGAAGIFLSGLSAVVALYYLYQRHRHVGIP